MGIDLALRQSSDATGTETPAFLTFLACYILAAALAWFRYVRPHGEGAGMTAQPATEAIVRM